MEQIEIFQVLGIAPTKEEKSIKNAYREKLSVTNPEDDPEGFKRLRTAFEEACRLAKQPDGEAEAEERDTSPSGLWAERAAGIYGNIISRQDLQQWEALFAEDIFLSLEEEENCRVKLLRFLMDHFRLPTDVWKLLDQKLAIVKDAARLRERFPADFISFIVNRCERGEDVVFDQFEGAADAPYDLFLQYYEQCYRALDAGQLEQAATLLQNADDLQIFHPVMEVCRADLHEKQGRVKEALGLLTELKERFPKDAMVCYNCAELMWRNEEKEKAAAIYEELKAGNDSHYMSNVRLTDWYYQQGRFKDAKKCAEEVLSVGGGDQFTELLRKVNLEIERELEEHYSREKDYESGLELGWCYLQDGKVNRGIRLAVEMEKQIPPDREAEYNGLLAKLYVEGAEYEDSICMTEYWEKSLQDKLQTDETEEEKEKDRDRLRQAHLIRMQCYRCLGYKDKENFSKAIKEAESIETGTSKDIGILLEKAQIYMEMEEYELSLENTRRLIGEYQVYAALATSQEVHRRQWNAAGVIRDGRGCINYFPNYIRAYENMAKVYLDLKNREELEQLLAEAEKNGIKSVILDAYRYQMDHKVPDTSVLDSRVKDFRKTFLKPVEDGNLSFYENGLPVVTEYLYWYPGSYMLVERAIFHKAAHHLDEAKEDYEKALVENPSNPYALNGLSFVYRYQGDYEKALIYIKRAVLYMDEEDISPFIYTDMAGVYSLLGDHFRALNAYKIFESKAGSKNKYQMRRMAVCMARCGDVKGAVEKLKEINGADTCALYDDLVDLYQVTGHVREAEETLIAWNKEIGAEIPFREKIFHRNARPSVKGYDHRQFYTRRAWQELLYGEREKVFTYFDKLIQISEKENDGRTGLCDGIFAGILLNQKKKGTQYAAKLQKWIQKEKFSGKNEYYDMEKARLQLDFLAGYYEKSDEELESMLEREAECEICHFCSYTLCKELEAVRILLLVRMGKREEALARLERNLKIQPLDEYMIAIRNRIGQMEQSGADTTER